MTATAPPANYDSGKSTVVFAVGHSPGQLSDCLAVFKELGINMTRIYSRTGKSLEQYTMEIDIERQPELKMKELRERLEKITGLAIDEATLEIPYFPKRPADLDHISHKTMECGEELDADHPGFKDEEYRKRREMITNIAKTYKHGSEIPRVEYTPQETETWGVVYRKLRELSQQHACKEYLHIFPLLEEHCGYAPDNIPQLEDISRFLKQCTGFSLRPVTGLLTPRDFLNGLAFRIFHSTQYIRHHSKPLYTPEPDVCHELLGHVPLFADPTFAEFSHEIGLASLGATEDEIKRLSTLYWFTVEFGLCRQHGDLKVYGAGILSSFGEMEYAMSDQPKLLPFDPEVTANTDYPITTYQPTYFVAQSFKDMTAKMKAWTSEMSRPFSVRYNAYTNTVELLDSKEKVLRLLQTVTTDLLNLQKALEGLL